MSTKPLLTISAFARAVELAPSTLRYYDEAGLLPPAEVDPRSGYRYYTPDLERRARLIGRMREVGVPVETMRLVLDASPEQATELLRAFARRTAVSARRTSETVEEVVSSLRGERHTPDPVVTAVDGPGLAAAIRRVSRAAAPEPASPLHAILLDVADAEIVVVATDRYWIAQWAVPLREPPAGERRTVVPLGIVEDLLCWLVRREEVTLSVSENGTRLTTEDEAYEIEKVEDRFPAYQMVTEAQDPPLGRATVDRQALLDETDDPVSLVCLTVGEDRMTVRPHGSAEGVHLDATTSGSGITVDFSAALLRSALGAMVGDAVTLAYAVPDRPVRVHSAEQQGFFALVMPSLPDQ